MEIRVPNKALALPLVCLALIACARSETPEEARAAAQQAQAEYDRLAAEGRGDAEDEIVGGASPGQINTAGPLTAGSWSLATVDGEQIARFGEEGAPVLTVACELGGGIDIRLPGVSPQGGSSTVFISSPEGGSTFTASDTVDDEPQTYISVPAADPFITRLMSGNGPYSLRMGGDARLNFPGDEALTGLVSTCDRRAGAASSEDAGDTDEETGDEGAVE